MLVVPFMYQPTTQKFSMLLSKRPPVGDVAMPYRIIFFMWSTSILPPLSQSPAGDGLYAQHCRASEYVESHFILLHDSEFHRCQHPLYINFMASALEEAITSIQLSDYASRMFIDLGFSLHRSY